MTDAGANDHPAVPVAAGPGRAATVIVVAGWALATLIPLLAAASQLPAGIPAADELGIISATFATLAAVTAGAILVLRVPANRTGWLLWGSGCLLAWSSGGWSLASPSERWAPWIAWCSQFGFVPAFVVLGLMVPLVFPTGRLPSARWRVVAGAGALGIILSSFYDAVGPWGVSTGTTTVPNPLAVPALADVVNVANGTSTALGVVCFLVVAGSLVRRYRRSTGIERLQLKWFAAAAGFTALAFAVAIGTSLIPGDTAQAVSNVAWPVALFGFGLIPVAIGIAILRYRLYDIDLILRRTAVYLPLTAILAGVYAASIALLQRVFVVVTGNPSDGAVILSTLILATVFTPVKSAIQAWVDRTFRDARDAERRLDEFVDGVADSLYVPAPDRVLRGFLGVVTAITHASGGAAYVAADGGERLVAETANRRSGPTTVIDVGGSRGAVGRLVLDVRGNGAPLRAHDLAAVMAAADRLAAAMGPAVAGDREPALQPTGARQVVLDTD